MGSVTDTKWFQWLLCIALIAAGTATATYAGREILLYRAAISNFLPVQARILSHDLEEIDSPKGDPTSSWKPVIAYEYTVGNQTYQSNNVLPRPFSAFKGWAEGVLESYPVGTVQTAYYNPAQPDESYLHRTKFSMLDYGALIFGLLCLVLGSAKSIELLWKQFRGQRGQ